LRRLLRIPASHEEGGASLQEFIARTKRQEVAHSQESAIPLGGARLVGARREKYPQRANLKGARVMSKAKCAVLAVAVVVVVTAVLAPAAMARQDNAPTFISASGTWTWVVNENSMKATTMPDGNTFLTGFEIGTWSGTFAGTAYEPFKALVVNAGGLWATLTINFRGEVNGVRGKMRMQVIAYAPADPNQPMNGSWWIEKGCGRLHGLHGAGTWTTYLDESVAPTYTGAIWFERHCHWEGDR
jgi:hypothetical protein